MLHPFTVTLTVTVTLTLTLTVTLTVTRTRTRTRTRARSIITTTLMIVLVLLRTNDCVTEFVLYIEQSAFSTFCPLYVIMKITAMTTISMVLMLESLITISIQKTEVGQD